METRAILRAAALLTGLSFFGPGLAGAQSGGTTAKPKPQGHYRVAGTVVNSKTSQPLSRVQVSITNTKNSKDVQSVVTSDQGRFQFQTGAGKYSLQGSKKGFLTSAYEQHENFWTGIVTGAGLDTENLILRLPPTALITGTVTDEVGEPVRGTTITVFRENHFAGAARIETLTSVATDDLGSYEVPSLSAGTYFVSATARPWYAVHAASPPTGGEMVSLVDPNLDVAFPLSYYKEASEADDATPIPIRPADHVEVDFHLSPVTALRLVFHLAKDTAGRFSLPTLLKPSFDGEGVRLDGHEGQVTSDVFEMTGLAPGKYTLQSQDPANGTMQAAAEVSLASDGQEVDLAAGAPTASVKIKVQFHGASQRSPRLFLGLRNEKGKVALAEVNGEDEADFMGVLPGEYDVIANSPYSVSSVASEEVAKSGHTLSVAAGASLPVTVLLVRGAATVEGVVEKSGQPVAAAMVVLVPNDPESHLELFRRDQSDLDGSFALAGIVPGTYTLLAIENGWDLDWAKPAVIESYRQHGQKVVVGDSGKGTLRLPSPVEVQPRL